MCIRDRNRSLEHPRDACAVSVRFHIVSDVKNLLDIGPVELFDRKDVATDEFQGGTPLGAVSSQRLPVLSMCYVNSWSRIGHRANNGP